ncbi:hypothetical protein [Paenibacillus silvae]|uniref:hypothetical protein n=1 Tax=Paenibacillus silvae TaxID=1325358 RepID=UPI002006C843|nr:hypothetical protein [Paenibacillus silvae]MCK6078516.1 hypothetical protein [Paenibacillus silvae]MCK6152836.1 hypothetical protein [Paenibacillus silvae]MCK6271288.1 hypothetical protein [Paenibacillus silvae]
MEPVAVLTDGERCINYEEIIQLFMDWIDSAPSDSVKETGRGDWEKSRYCIVDYRNAEQAVAAAKAIRAFVPDVPVLVLTDFQSSIRKRHLQQITGTGAVKMMLWNEQHPDQLKRSIEQWLHTLEYGAPITMPSVLYHR